MSYFGLFCLREVILDKPKTWGDFFFSGEVGGDEDSSETAVTLLSAFSGTFSEIKKVDMRFNN